MDAKTMHEFDALCLTPVINLSAAQIKRLRTLNKASQAVFAADLNTSPSTVITQNDENKKDLEARS